MPINVDTIVFVTYFTTIINTMFDNSSAPLLTFRKVRRNRLNSEVFSVDIRCISPILAYIYGVLSVDKALDMRMIDGNDCDRYARICMS